MSIKTYL